MRTEAGHHESLARWATRQRRRHWIIGVTLAAGIAGLLVVRAAVVEDDAAVAPRYVGQLVAVDERSLTLTLRSTDGVERAATPLGVSAAPDQAQAIARLLAESTAPPARLTLAFDPDLRHQPDGLGRWMAYIYLTDGRMLNETLLEEGLANSNGQTPHELSRWFAQLEHRARRRGIGTWAGGGPSKPSAATDGAEPRLDGEE